MSPFEPLAGQMQWPFIVESHNHMLFRVVGKERLTVLTIERLIYSYRICEYIAPLEMRRFWDYEALDEALAALITYCERYEQAEPLNWQRASDIDYESGGYRTRKSRLTRAGRIYYEAKDE